MRAWLWRLKVRFLRCTAFQFRKAYTVGDSLRYQALLDLPLRFGNNLPSIRGPH